MNLVYDAIVSNPSIRFNEIKEITGLNNGTITHNIKKLADSKSIDVYFKDGIAHYFSKGFDYADRQILRFLRKQTPRYMIGGILKHGIMTVTEMSRYVQKSMGTVSIFKDQLLDAGIIKPDIGNRVCYKLADVRLTKLLVKQYHKDLAKKMIATPNITI